MRWIIHIRKVWLSVVKQMFLLRYNCQLRRNSDN